jgi:hypothetical protein
VAGADAVVAGVAAAVVAAGAAGGAALAGGAVAVSAGFSSTTQPASAAAIDKQTNPMCLGIMAGLSVRGETAPSLVGFNADL